MSIRHSFPNQKKISISAEASSLHELLISLSPHPKAVQQFKMGLNLSFMITMDLFQSMLESHQWYGLEAEDITNQCPAVPAHKAFQALKIVFFFFILSQETILCWQRLKPPRGG